MSMIPAEVKTVVPFAKIIHRGEKKIHPDDRMSSRMVKCASVLEERDFIGWMMNIPASGLVRMSVFGTGTVSRGDLEWIAEKTAIFQTEECPQPEQAPELLYELSIGAGNGGEKRMGFGAGSGEGTDREPPSPWPMSYSSQFAEVIRALREDGALTCAFAGKASPEEQVQCRIRTLKNWSSHEINPRDYIGTPVKIRFLLRLPAVPSIRLKSVLETAVPGIRIAALGSMREKKCQEIWEKPLADAPVLPDFAARILLMEPVVQETVIGIETCEEPVPDLPATHDNTKTEHALRIGTAMGTDGMDRDITIGETDLKRHVEIIGQTGTGKSTLMASMILQAIREGYPCTFLDPHGSTIDTVLRSVPEEYAGRIRVVRIGDAENPVPLNFWDTGDPCLEERNISDLCELFQDIFDPRNEGIVGPRYERWLSTFAKASLALLGRRASLESIAVLSQSKDNMLKLSKAIYRKYPDLVETIKEEYGKDNSNEFNATLSYYLSKFQRLTSVEQLRKTLGAGTNALDFPENVDRDTVTLIDLASPEIGAYAARIIGTMILVKFWNAILQREDRTRTHLLFLDEAQVYCRTNPLPRMMAESRKFGLSIVLCHQHEGQLTPEVRESLEANSANLISFRLSPKDAALTGVRLNGSGDSAALARLDAFKAVTTLSVDGIQTAPFTLRIGKVEPLEKGEKTAEQIEKRSVDTLVKPYRKLRALTPAEILEALEPHAKLTGTAGATAKAEPDTEPAWITQWKKERSSPGKAG